LVADLGQAEAVACQAGLLQTEEAMDHPRTPVHLVAAHNLPARGMAQIDMGVVLVMARKDMRAQSPQPLLDTDQVAMVG
jgi:hypothetical protein